MSIIYIQCNLQAHLSEHHHLIECLKITHKQCEQRGSIRCAVPSGFQRFLHLWHVCFFDTTHQTVYCKMWWSDVACFFGHETDLLQTSQNNTGPVVVCCSANSGQITWYSTKPISAILPSVSVFCDSCIFHDQHEKCDNTALLWLLKFFPATTNVKTEDFGRRRPPARLAPTCRMWLVSYTVASWRRFVLQLCVCLIVGLTGKGIVKWTENSLNKVIPFCINSVYLLYYI